MSWLLSKLWDGIEWVLLGVAAVAMWLLSRRKSGAEKALERVAKQHRDRAQEHEDRAREHGAAADAAAERGNDALQAGTRRSADDGERDRRRAAALERARRAAGHGGSHEG